MLARRVFRSNTPAVWLSPRSQAIGRARLVAFDVHVHARGIMSVAEDENKPSKYDQFLLFGASIIEQASTQERGFALVPALQQAYIRRLDVINRGFSGFNTKLGLKALPQIIPDPKESRVRFLAVLFGSNDACFEEAKNGQHVPLSEYKANLVKIFTHPAVQAHRPRLILVTPPPIEERRLEDRVKSQGYTKLNRSNECTKLYADVAREVAGDLGVACLDLWGTFMAQAGWKEGQPLYGSINLPENAAIRDLIHDGLHFTPKAYRIFYDEIMELIAKEYPDQIASNLSYVIPAWDDTEAWAKKGLNMGSPAVVKHN